MLDRGPSARSLKINLERFTLVGATTRSGLLSSPLRARFGVTMRLDYYGAEDLARIVTPLGRHPQGGDRAPTPRARSRAGRAARRAWRTACCGACATSR